MCVYLFALCKVFSTLVSGDKRDPGGNITNLWNRIKLLSQKPVNRGDCFILLIMWFRITSFGVNIKSIQRHKDGV